MAITHSRPLQADKGNRGIQVVTRKAAAKADAPPRKIGCKTEKEATPKPRSAPKPSKGEQQGNALFGWVDGKPAKVADDFRLRKATTEGDDSAPLASVPPIFRPGNSDERRKAHRATLYGHGRPLYTEGAHMQRLNVDHDGNTDGSFFRGYTSYGENPLDSRASRIVRGKVIGGIRASDGGDGCAALRGIMPGQYAEVVGGDWRLHNK